MTGERKFSRSGFNDHERPAIRRSAEAEPVPRKAIGGST